MAHRLRQGEPRLRVMPDGKKVVFNRQVNGKKNTIGIYTMRLD
jgi:hypothetical protein